VSAPCAGPAPSAPVSAPIPSAPAPAIAVIAGSATPSPAWSPVFSTTSGDGYVVDPKWVKQYPDLYGPDAKDPDNGEGDFECNDAISQIVNKFTGIGGTFSTWGERHAFIIAAQIGYLNVHHDADVPPVPTFFLKEAHYWRTGIIMGRAAAKLETQMPDWKIITGIFAAGGVTLTAIWKLLLPFLGVG
jgi:hypothetical protein